MDLMQLIQGQLTEGVMDQLVRQSGGNQQQTAAATNGILSTLIGAMAKNATSSQEGASSLFNALNNDHDGSLLDNIGDYLNPERPNPVNERTANGMGILNHLFGPKQEQISRNIGQHAGLDQQSTLGLMAKLAPIVMAVMGKQQQSQGFSVTDLMGFMTNQQSSMQQQSGVGSFLKLLDFDGDGNPLDDAMGLLSKFLKK